EVSQGAISGDRDSKTAQDSLLLWKEAFTRLQRIKRGENVLEGIPLLGEISDLLLSEATGGAQFRRWILPSHVHDSLRGPPNIVWPARPPLPPPCGRSLCPIPPVRPPLQLLDSRGSIHVPLPPPFADSRPRGRVWVFGRRDGCLSCYLR